MTLTVLVSRTICPRCEALRLPESVLEALTCSLGPYLSIDLAGTDKLRVLFQNEKFMDELGSLTCRQRLKAGTLSMEDLVERYSTHSSGLLPSSSTMSTSSSSSNSMTSDMSS